MEEKERFEYYPKQNQLYDKINDELYCLGIEQDKTRLVDFLNLMNEDLWTLYERNKELREELENYKLCRCVDCSSEYEYGLETSIDELEKENQQLKQQLTDYTKQVRKEVCDEIRKILFEFLLTYDVITDKLDQLRG